MLDSKKTQVQILGEAIFPNPLMRDCNHFVEEDDAVLICSTTKELKPYQENGLRPPTFEQAGPRRKIFFNAAERSDDINCGIVTCGGLCPGLNDVIRSIVLTAKHSYGVNHVYGFPYGYAGLAAAGGLEPTLLTHDIVERIHEQGGSLLGSSRGPQSMDDMIANLQKYKIQILFAIGGDGTLKGAKALSEEITKRKLAISVIAIPKTIDNDISWVERSFGFATAVEEAGRALKAGHAEAYGAYNGIGIVKLMGRHSGFITAHATLANNDVNFCLIPEVPFSIEGDSGFFRALEQRLYERHHAVIAVAEGAGQELIKTSGAKDASGNIKLNDIGHFIKEKIADCFSAKHINPTIKYIDPSYMIRSLAANAIDSEFCLALGQHAVHAGMSGRTNIMIGFWNQYFTHVPINLAVADRKQLDPFGDMWQRVLLSTGQPSFW